MMLAYLTGYLTAWGLTWKRPPYVAEQKFEVGSAKFEVSGK